MRARTLLAAASVAALVPFAVMTAATAAPNPPPPKPHPITAQTHVTNHPDTTSVSGACTGTGTGGGPVWALDDLQLQLSAVSDGTNTYAVTVTAHGNFTGISNPITGDCEVEQGSVQGWYDLEVISPTPPDGANVAHLLPGSLSQGDIVGMFFGGKATTITGGSYSYTYHNIDGSPYNQAG